jgi:hypothetical protein
VALKGESGINLISRFETRIQDNDGPKSLNFLSFFDTKSPYL